MLRVISAQHLKYVLSWDALKNLDSLLTLVPKDVVLVSKSRKVPKVSSQL